jgi:hypothetical protein
MTTTPESKHGSFHTHANLVQTLNSITAQHFKDIRTTKETPSPQLPHFMAEAVHMICYNLAGAVNGDPFTVDSWEGIAKYATEVSITIKKIQLQQQKEENKAIAEEKKEFTKNPAFTLADL